MIQKVKYGMAFLAGAIYASSWWLYLTSDSVSDWMFFPIAVVSVGSMALLLSIIISVGTHWND